MTVEDALDFSLAGLADRTFKVETVAGRPRIWSVLCNREVQYSVKPGTTDSDHWRDASPSEIASWSTLRDWNPVCRSATRASYISPPTDIGDVNTKWSSYAWNAYSLDCQRKFGRIGLILPYVGKLVSTPKGSGILLTCYKHITLRRHVGVVRLAGTCVYVPLVDILPS